MAITADELAAVRDWVPDTWTPEERFDDSAVGATWDRLALEPEDSTDDVIEATSLSNVYAVARAMSRRMLAGLIGDPDSFSIGGEYSESRGAGLNALMAQISTLEGLAQAATDLVTGRSKVVAYQLCRPNFHGR